jgi:hypothetical protein
VTEDQTHHYKDLNKRSVLMKPTDYIATRLDHPEFKSWETGDIKFNHAKIVQTISRYMLVDILQISFSNKKDAFIFNVANYETHWEIRVSTGRLDNEIIFNEEAKVYVYSFFEIYGNEIESIAACLTKWFEGVLLDNVDTRLEMLFNKKPIKYMDRRTLSVMKNRYHR